MNEEKCLVRIGYIFGALLMAFFIVFIFLMLMRPESAERRLTRFLETRGYQHVMAVSVPGGEIKNQGGPECPRINAILWNAKKGGRWVTGWACVGEGQIDPLDVGIAQQ